MILETDSFLRPYRGAPFVPAQDALPRPPRRLSDGRPVGRAVRPSAAVEASYDARLRRLVDEMHASVAYWVGAAYRREGDRIESLGLATDAAYISCEDGSGSTSPAIGSSPPTRSDPSSPLIRSKGFDFPPSHDLALDSDGRAGALDHRAEVPTQIALDAPYIGGGRDRAAVPDPDLTRGTPAVWGSSGRAPSLPLALDARPSTALQKIIRQLRRRWLGRFDDASQDLARYFAKAVWQRSDSELRKILKRGNISVEFRVSRAVRDALAAIVHENVALIRSIPQQYLSQVEASVMRSVTAGRDLASLTADFQHHHGVTRKRAELIATQQNNSATGAIQRLQYLEVGIERAIWRHSHAGKYPRPTHVANDGHEYDVRTGWWDPHERRYIRTGELIHCRCFSQPVLPR